MHRTTRKDLIQLNKTLKLIFSNGFNMLEKCKFSVSGRVAGWIQNATWNSEMKICQDSIKISETINEGDRMTFDEFVEADDGIFTCEPYEDALP